MSTGTSSPRMIGRDAELSALRDALAASGDGHPRAVVVRGEAGIGKTRLLHEFLLGASAEPRHPTLVIATGQCVDLGAIGAPFTPIRRLLHELYAAVGDEAFRDAAGSPAIVATLSSLIPEMGATPTPEGGNAHVSEAVERLLEELSRDHHLVLLIEDLHWADAATLTLLKNLVVTLRGAHILMIATYRSDDVGRGHPLRPVLAELDRSRHVRGLALGRLSADEIVEQIREIGADVPADALHTVVARSEGVPFFVEELIELDGTALPDTLRDVVLARYERLSDGARGVVGLVSAGGMHVDHDVLTEVHAGEAGVLADGLREAISANVLVATGEEYGFRHALIQEAVHDELLPSERSALHRRYAETLQRRVDAGDLTLAAPTAEHWLAARESARAFDASVEALAHARATFAPASAAAIGERLLELWTHVPEPAGRAGASRGRLSVDVADAWTELGDMSRAIRVARAGLAEPESLDVVDRAILHSIAAAALGNLGRVEEAYRDTETAIALLETSDAPEAIGLLSRAHAQMWMMGDAYMGGPGESGEHLEEALRLAEISGDDTALTKALVYSAWKKGNAGDFEGALAEARRTRGLRGRTCLDRQRSQHRGRRLLSAASVR